MIVIADDLSGAAELAGIAFARGFTAEVQREFDPASKAEVIAVDTDSRGLSPDAAARRVEHVAKAVASARPAWIYKKVDSVLRGNVRAEIEALLRITGKSRAILIPANPSRGRTIEGGQLLIDGVPLDQTPFRKDPDHPRLSSVVAELLGSSDRIDVPDLADSAALRSCVERLNADTLPAGAADFFAALLDARGAGQGRALPASATVSIERPALLVCGSRAAWESRQRECEAAGVPIWLVSDPFEDLESHIRQAADKLAVRGLLAVAIGDDWKRARESHELLPRLATVAAMLLDIMPVATLLAEGGATAAAISRRLAWNRFRVVQSAPAGVGVLQPLEIALAPTFLIKPGSYAWPEEIWRQLK